MAEAIEKVISIKTEDGERSVKGLKAEISSLRDALLNVEQGSSDWETITKKLIQDQNDLASVTKVSAQEINVASDSIAGMEKQYSSMYKAYRELTEEQRNSDFGKNMAESLNTLSTKLNESKKEVGNYKDNIGRYCDGAMEAFSKLGISIGGLQGPLKLATGGVKGLKDAISKLEKGTVILMAISLVVKGLGNAIKGNEELQNKWNKAMAAFKPIGEAVTKAMNWLATAIVNVATGVGNLLGKLSKASKATQDLSQAQAEYNQHKRETEELNATEKSEVERLRDEAASTSDVAKKTELLLEAKQKQGEIDQRNVALAQENLDILQAEADRLPNSKEANDQLSAAKVALSNAEAAASTNARTFDKQLTTLNTTMENTASKAEKVKSTLEQISDEITEDILSWDIESPELKFDDSIDVDGNAGNASAFAQKRIEQETAIYNHEVTMAEYSIQNEEELEQKKLQLYEDYTAKKMSLINAALSAETDPDKILELQEQRQELQNEIEEKGAQKRVEIAKKEMNQKKQVFSAMNSIMGSVASAYESYIKQQVESGDMSEEEGERQFEFVKALQYAQVIMNGISAGWAAFQGIEASTGGWGTVAAYAQLAAVIASSVASAMQIKNTKLSTSSSTSSSSSSTSAIIPPTINESNPYTYTRTLTTAAEEDALNTPIKAYVVDKDLVDGINNYNERENESTF